MGRDLGLPMLSLVLLGTFEAVRCPEPGEKAGQKCFNKEINGYRSQCKASFPLVVRCEHVGGRGGFSLPGCIQREELLDRNLQRWEG